MKSLKTFGIGCLKQLNGFCVELKIRIFTRILLSAVKLKELCDLDKGKQLRG